MFGIGIVRSREKALISDYRATVLRALENGGHPSLLIDIANLPDVIRGYEDVKLRNIETYNERKAQLMSQATGSKRASDSVDKMVSHLH